MGVSHNFHDFAEALDRAPERFKEDVFRPLARYVDQHFVRISTQEYMQEGPTTFEEAPPPRPANLSGPLRKVSLRLSRAVEGSFTYGGSGGTRESTTVVKVTTGGLKWQRQINVPYARIHEKGGSFTVPTTEKMVAYFWARYYETEQSRYKNLALAAKAKKRFNITIPARPYVRPALRDVAPIAADRAGVLLDSFMRSVLE